MNGSASAAKLLLAMATFLCVVHVLHGGVVDRQPRAYRQYSDGTVQKRPFCNAFTGCGKKRSAVGAFVPPAPSSLLQRHMQRHEKVTDDDDMPEDTLGSLLDLNTEPAVEDLMRQIMSEAKLWEAIQEANRELYLQKTKPHNNEFPISFSTQ